MRYVSGLAVLPAWIRHVDGLLIELLAVSILAAVVVLVWVWAALVGS